MSNFASFGKAIGGQIQKFGDTRDRFRAEEAQADAIREAREREIELDKFQRSTGRALMEWESKVSRLAPQDQVTYFDEQNTGPESWTGFQESITKIDPNDKYYQDKINLADELLYKSQSLAIQMRDQAKDLKYGADLQENYFAKLEADDVSADLYLAEQVQKGFVSNDAAQKIRTGTRAVYNENTVRKYIAATKDLTLLQGVQVPPPDPNNKQQMEVYAAREKAKKSLSEIDPKIAKSLIEAIENDITEQESARIKGIETAYLKNEISYTKFLREGRFNDAVKLRDAAEKDGQFLKPNQYEEWVSDERSWRDYFKVQVEASKDDGVKAALDKAKELSASSLEWFKSKVDANVADINGVQLELWLKGQRTAQGSDKVLTPEDIDKGLSYLKERAGQTKGDENYAFANEYIKGITSRVAPKDSKLAKDGRATEVEAYANQVFRLAYETEKANNAGNIDRQKIDKLLKGAESLTAARFNPKQYTDAIKLGANAARNEVVSSYDTDFMKQVQKFASSGELVVGIAAKEPATLQMLENYKAVAQQVATAGWTSPGSAKEVQTVFGTNSPKPSEIVLDTQAIEKDGLPLVMYKPATKTGYEHNGQIITKVKNGVLNVYNPKTRLFETLESFLKNRYKPIINPPKPTVLQQ